MNTKDKLVSALTQFDARQSTKRGYNRNALAIYFRRLDEICADVERGADLRAAITAGFTGRVLDCCLRALGMPTSTKAEQGSAITYQPVKNSLAVKPLICKACDCPLDENGCGCNPHDA